MGTDKKTQIRIIKQGMVGSIPESQAAPLSRETPKKDLTAELIRSVSGWVAEFKERRQPDPRMIFQALFKEL